MDARRAAAPKPGWRVLVPLALASAIYCESSRRLPIDLPGQSDKLLHAIAFGALAASLAWALAPGVMALGRWRLAALAFALSAVWGVLDEIHQSFVPGRDADVLDAVADATGAAAASVAGAWWLGRTRQGR